MWAPVGKIASGKKWLRWWYGCLERLPADKLYGYYDRLVKKWNQRETKWVRILMFPTPNTEYGYLRKWYAESEKIEFEGKTFWGIQDVDGYLSFKFGKYMELPPPEQRKVHPVTELGLAGPRKGGNG